ncbi:hypothetical protein Dimus_035510 [Dionaea muscipula]
MASSLSPAAGTVSSASGTSPLEQPPDASFSVAFSIDNRQIVSASRDRTIRLWNTLGECKFTIENNDAHTDWVSCVRFSPNTLQPTIVSSSWDKTVKVWNLTNCKLRSTLAGHAGYVNTVAVSPDGSLCASGGKDGVILLWDLSEGKRLYSLDAATIIHSLCFSPNRYWLCAATENGIKIWDLESKSILEDLKVDLKQEAESGEGAAHSKKKIRKMEFYLMMSVTEVFFGGQCFKFPRILILMRCPS